MLKMATVIFKITVIFGIKPPDKFASGRCVQAAEPAVTLSMLYDGVLERISCCYIDDDCMS